MINKKYVKKILIIKLRGIGDVVLSTIVLDNLKEDFPEAIIDYLTDLPSKSVIEGLPQINKVITFPKQGIWRRLKLFLKIRWSNYDLIFDCFANPTTAQLTFISGARYKIGFPYKGRKYAYNYLGPAERNKYHSALLHLITLENAGLSHTKQNLYFYIDNSDYLIVKKYFKENNLINKIVVGFSPSGGWQSKKCEPEKFALIGNAIKKKYNVEILILWGKSDFDEATKIHQLIPNSFLAPHTSIREMGAFIQSCSFLIANDSGPMHISTAVGTPVLSLHGPTDPLLQGPFGNKHEWINYAELDCIKCNLLVCPKKHECFIDLPLERIMEKLKLLIEKNNIKI